MKKAFILFFLFAVMSCSTKNESVPPDLIPQDSMVSIMVDIHLAEASMPAMQIYGEKMNEVALEHYAHIYKLHHVTEEQFKTSHEYYIAHPDVYKDIYEQVVKSLQKMKP